VLQAKDLDRVMQKLSQGAVSDDQVTRLAAKNAQTMQGRARVWRSEIAKHKLELRRDYQEYVEQLWKAEQTAPDESPSRRFMRMDSVDEDTAGSPARGRGSTSQVDDGSLAARGTGMLKRGFGMLRRSAASGGDGKGSSSSALYRALSPSSVTSDPDRPLEESFTVSRARVFSRDRCVL
jgi:hypothetical protein